MSDFVAAMIPLIVCWTLPLTPLLFAVTVGLIETFTKPDTATKSRRLAHFTTGGAP